MLVYQICEKAGNRCNGIETMPYCANPGLAEQRNMDARHQNGNKYSTAHSDKNFKDSRTAQSGKGGSVSD